MLSKEDLEEKLLYMDNFEEYRHLWNKFCCDWCCKNLIVWKMSTFDKVFPDGTEFERMDEFFSRDDPYFWYGEISGVWYSGEFTDCDDSALAGWLLEELSDDDYKRLQIDLEALGLVEEED